MQSASDTSGGLTRVSSPCKIMYANIPSSFLDSCHVGTIDFLTLFTGMIYVSRFVESDSLLANHFDLTIPIS